MEEHRYTKTRIQRRQSHLSVHGASSSGTGNLVAKVNNESESKVAPTVVSILTKSPATFQLVQEHRENFENLPEDIRVSKACDDAGFRRKVSLGQVFVTLHDIELAGFGFAGSCREYTSSRDDKRSKPRRWIRENTKIGPVLEVTVTSYLERYGIQVKIDSMPNDGTQSWIVISRGIKKYVTELPEENKKPIHYEEVASSTGKLVAIKQQEQVITSSSSLSSTIMPINQRKWNDISAVGKLVDKSYKISNLMTRLLRHQGDLREDDGSNSMEKNP